jgi:hypothetical protein
MGEKKSKEMRTATWEVGEQLKSVLMGKSRGADRDQGITSKTG